MDEKQKWHFFNLYCMAVADGDFALQELEALYKIAKEQGIKPEQINTVVMNAGLHPALPQSLEEKVGYLYDLARMAWADGVIEQAERDLMHRYVTLFGFNPDNTDGIIDYFLEKVKAGATTQEIINELNQ